jgi:hypothetical protein
VAVALDWDGSVDTDLSWTEFFGSEHTMLVRFMPAYTYTIDGPILASTGTDAFELGIGSFPGAGAVRVPLPLVRVRAGGADLLLESGSAKPTGRTFADFDGSTYEGWTATGNCFGSAPASGTFPNQNPVLDFEGRGLVNTQLNGNGTTGVLTSPTFVVQRPYMRFLIGGGHFPGRCCLNLLQGAQVVRTATGRDNERLTWMCWDVREFLGDEMRVEIVDKETVSWGHVLVDQIEFCDAPLLQPRLWQELAVVRAPNASTYTPYLNGEVLGPPIELVPSYLPSGMRIGGWGYTGRPSQFYGLIDEVAAYTRALTQPELRARLRAPARMTGSETGLLAGWTFSSAPQPVKLARPLTLKGSARLVATSPGTNSMSDALKLPLPAQTVPTVLPFPVGEEWTVIQEFDERLGSHSGPAAFCWDFVRAAGATNGASVFAVAGGEVNQVNESDPDDSDNLVEIHAATDEFHAYLHTRQNASALTVGAQVAQGALVSVIGKRDHLHFNLGPGSGTRPLAFRNYERKERSGGWTTVDIGMPRNFETIRQLSPPAAMGAEFVSQTVPTSTRANDVMNVSITMRNTGTSAWTQADAVRLGCNAPIWDVTPVDLPVVAVAPGQTVTFAFEALAPPDPGTKAFHCRMQHANAWFGESTPSAHVLVLVDA